MFVPSAFNLQTACMPHSHSHRRRLSGCNRWKCIGRKVTSHPEELDVKCNYTWANHPLLCLMHFNVLFFKHVIGLSSVHWSTKKCNVTWLCIVYCRRTVVRVQGEFKKVTSCDFCWYFSNACKFLREILRNKIYTLSPSFVHWGLCLKKTRLYCFSQDINPFLSVPSITQNWLRFHRKDWVAPNSVDLTMALDNCIWSAMLD